jgi:hydroxyacylglutathione hydrolase
MKEKRFGPVLFLPGLNSGRYPYCNSIYIESHGILVDPASDRKRLMRLKKEERVQKVWLTHFHEDHIKDLDLFDDLPLYISEDDAEPISDLDRFMDWDWFELKEEEKEWWMTALRNNFNYRPRKPAAYLKGNEVLEKNGVSIEIIQTPGHTPGNLSFYIREPGVLFIGDYDLTKFGPYYGDRGSSIEDTIASIAKLRQLPAKIILTSHETGIFENPDGALWDRYVEVITTREHKLLEFLRSPRTLQEIVNAHIVYGREREPKSFFEIGERSLMKKHLGLLLAKKLIHHDGVTYRRI